MSFLATPGSWVDAGSGLLLVALGLFLLSVRPRRRTNLALAAFSILFGLSQVVGNLVRDAAGGNPLSEHGVALQAAAMVPLVLVALWVPRPWRRAERARLLVLPAAAVALSTLLWVASEFAAPAQNGPFDGRWVVLEVLLGTMAFGGFYIALLSQALRFPSLAGPGGARERRNGMLLSAALLTYPGWVVGLTLGDAAARWATDFPAFLAETGLGPLPGGLLAAAFLVNNTWLVFHVALAGLWLRNAERHGGGRAARDLALLALALPLAALLAHPLLGPVPGDAGLNGGMRLLTVAILAYAILRHQLLDIDVKVRWGIRQSTLAGVFIGVFFVVSEGAQQFLADDQAGLGLGPYLGIAATGLLVFALAPLQQAAERLATAAVPGAKAVGEMSRDERAELYRAMTRTAWQDGVLDRNERALLKELQQRLALTPAEAERLEAEALAG